MNAQRSERSIALRLRVLHTHAPGHGGPLPFVPSQAIGALSKEGGCQAFFHEGPQRAKQENWKGVAKSSRKPACFRLRFDLQYSVSRMILGPSILMPCGFGHRRSQLRVV